MHLDLLPGEYAIARLPAGSEIPAWAQGGDLLSITRTPHELSIVCVGIPEDVPCVRNWRCLKVRGPLDFSLTGILASLATPLAAAGVAIFAVSTFDTDHILILESSLPHAIAALTKAGHILN
jgi:hypothetical protein